MSDKKPQGSECRPTMPSARWRVALSAALLVHLVAVVAPPLSVEGSPVFVGLSRLLGWYVDPLRLNNGYRFFGPDPPQYSFLVDYEAYCADGTVVRGRFPDLQAQWPRLLYHRYFMLSSRLQGAVPPQWLPAAPTAEAGSAPPPVAPAAAGRELQQSPGAVELLGSSPPPAATELDAEPIAGPPRGNGAQPGPMPPAVLTEMPYVPWPRRDQPVAADHPYVRSYAQHLAARYNAVRVKLYLVAHRAPGADEVLRGVRLHDTLPPREACPLLIDYTPGEVPAGAR
jgi:hypothetical protein